MAAKRKVGDLEKLELDYRAGLHTFREMAETHGISGPRIKQIADKDGWVRDLGAKIRQTAAAKLAKPPSTPEKLETERQIVERGSDNIVTIVLSHRKDALRTRALGMALMAELESMTTAPVRLQDLHECLTKCASGQDIPSALLNRADAALGQALTLGNRAGIFKTLAESLSRVVAMEVAAYSLRDPTPPPPTVDGRSAGMQSVMDKFAAVIAAHTGAKA